jgi:hypothetical protein
MADIYTSEINGRSGQRRSDSEDRLSPVTAVFAIFTISLLLWTPLLLPVLRLLHGQKKTISHPGRAERWPDRSIAGNSITPGTNLRHPGLIAFRRQTEGKVGSCRKDVDQDQGADPEFSDSR